MDQKTFDLVIKDMVAGLGLVKSLEKHKVDPHKFYDAVWDNPVWIQSYERAQQSRSELLVEELIDISDSDDYGKARNQIDVRKWYASKMRPQKYGDRVDINITQTVDIGAALLEARQRSLQLSQTHNVQTIDVIDVSPIKDTGSQPVALSNDEDIDIFS